MLRPLRLLLGIFLIGGLAPLGAHAQPLQFTDVAPAAGLTWSPVDPGILVGASTAWADLNGDGHLDVVLAGGTTFGQPVAIFLNMGNGTFSDVTAAAGLAQPFMPSAYYMSATCADYDNDGDPDIYLGCRNRPNILYRNDGNLSFIDVTVQAGVGDPLWTASVAFGDYDRDGWLDIFNVNYIGTLNFPNHVPDPNKLYRNNGDGTFTDVTAACGVGGAGTGLAGTFSDYDGDGDDDILVVNDFGDTIEPNQIWRNDGPAAGPPGSWLFTDVAASTGAALQIYGMGVAAGDFDRDLDIDYYFTNLGNNVFLRNESGLAFTDVTTATGTGFQWDPYFPTLLLSSWGSGLFDFDQDGWLDLFVSNGHIPAASYIANSSLAHNLLFHHDGASLGFTERGQSAGVDDLHIGRSCSFADWDHDGDIDILQLSIDSGPALFRNDSPTGNFLRILPVGRISNRDGLGTRAQADLPGFSLLRECTAHASYCSTSERNLHFGLGAESVVDTLTLRWPSGVVQRLHQVPANIDIALAEPLISADPTSTAPTTVASGNPLVQSLVLRNDAATTLNAGVLLQISVGGLLLYTSPILAIPVPGQGTSSLPLVLDIPAGATQGATVPVEFLWWISDGVTLTQWRTVVTITP